MELIDNSKEEKKQKKADKKYERVLSDVRRVCQLPEGRRTLRMIMEDGAPFRDGYTGETNSTMYNLGRQAVSRNVLNVILDADPRLLPLIMNEAESEAKSEEVQEKIDNNNSGDLVQALEEKRMGYIAKQNKE